MRKLITIVLPSALVLAACGRSPSEKSNRDLTLLARPSESSAIASSRELDLARGTPESPARTDASARRPRPERAPAVPAKPADEASPPAPEPAPAPAPEPKVVAQSQGGAGMALEPGQSVTVLPATSGAAPGPLPDPILVSDRQGSRPWIIIGDDRCIPGRGEMPAGLRPRRR